MTDRTLDPADRFEIVAGDQRPKEIDVLEAVQRKRAAKPDHRWARARAVESAG